MLYNPQYISFHFAVSYNYDLSPPNSLFSQISYMVRCWQGDPDFADEAWLCHCICFIGNFAKEFSFFIQIPDDALWCNFWLLVTHSFNIGLFEL